MTINTYSLLANFTGLGAGPSVTAPANEKPEQLRAYSVGMTGGSGAVVRFQASTNARTWVTLATATLGPGSAEGFSTAVPWAYVRCYVDINDGTLDATITTVENNRSL